MVYDTLQRINDIPAIFINGVNATAGYGAIGSGGYDTFTIGDSGAGTYAGYLDDIGLWDKSLTPTEITELYNGGNGKRPSISPILLTSTQTWDRTITDATLWNVQACDSDGDCGFASENRTLDRKSVV